MLEELGELGIGKEEYEQIINEKKKLDGGGEEEDF